MLIALLAFPAAALGDGAGFNPATRKLESAFTVALSARVNSTNGCYPAESALAKSIAKQAKTKTAVTKSLKGVRKGDVVYLLKGASNCNNVRMALRHGRTTYQLDSAIGEIKVIGANRIPQLVRQNRGPLRALKLATKTFRMNSPHQRDRMDVRCPGGRYPLGGGMITSPPLGADGEGVFPHSYERLGAQRGWHITAWLRDPTVPIDASRSVTLQAMCARGLVPYSAPHKTAFTLPGQTKTVTATCPKGQVLMGGGYQRFDFLNDGGNYPTESRAIGTKRWRVSGTAYGAYGGELTAIAYCVPGKGRLLREVSSPVAPVANGAVASATSARCPKGTRLTANGFSLNGGQLAFFAGASLNGNNTATAHAFGAFGPAPGLTAYGYCLKPGV